MFNPLRKIVKGPGKLREKYELWEKGDGESKRTPFPYIFVLQQLVFIITRQIKSKLEAPALLFPSKPSSSSYVAPVRNTQVKRFEGAPNYSVTRVDKITVHTTDGSGQRLPAPERR